MCACWKGMDIPGFDRFRRYLFVKVNSLRQMRSTNTNIKWEFLLKVSARLDRAYFTLALTVL